MSLTDLNCCMHVYLFTFVTLHSGTTEFRSLAAQYTKLTIFFWATIGVLTSSLGNI